MADPAGSPGLPPGEFVELYNRSNKVVSLGGCYLHDAASGCPVPDDTIKPGDFIVYTTVTDAPAFHAGGILRVRGVGCFPTLNNDGDSLRFIGPSGALIDAVDYDKGMYADPLRDDQGWSLERIDVSTKCSSRENWKASVDPSGGTPGRLNSAQGIYRDSVAPLLVHAYPADDSTTLLYFTEWPDTASSNDPALYILDPGGVNPIAVRAGKGNPHMEVKWPQPLLPGVNYTLVVDSRISDCSGNNLEGMYRVPLGLPEPIAFGDLIINEVLFNPIGEDGDFVEVYNQSTHSIDLGEIRFAEADPADGIIKNAVGLQSERRILMPGEYAVATPYPDRISGRYPMNGKVNLLTASLSGYDDDEGIVVLLDASLRVLDQFRYSDDFHFPLLADPEGVSLERLRFDGHTYDGQNWHSASSQCGYATPGLKNSQQVDSIAEQDAWFFLEPRLFSPDNDGHHDVLLLNASLPKPGYMAAVNIYSEQGMLVSRIAANEYLGPEGRWTWNGTGDDGYMLPPGLYIVSARFLHIDGDVRTIRKACVLAPSRISN
jgi:hypothetical protein